MNEIKQWCRYISSIIDGYNHPKECDDRCIAYWREKDETCIDICGKDCRKDNE